MSGVLAWLPGLAPCQMSCHHRTPAGRAPSPDLLLHAMHVKTASPPLQKSLPLLAHCRQSPCGAVRALVATPALAGMRKPLCACPACTPKVAPTTLLATILHAWLWPAADPDTPRGAQLEASLQAFRQLRARGISGAFTWSLDNSAAGAGSYAAERALLAIAAKPLAEGQPPQGHVAEGAPLCKATRFGAWRPGWRASMRGTPLCRALWRASPEPTPAWSLPTCRLIRYVYGGIRQPHRDSRARLAQPNMACQPRQACGAPAERLRASECRVQRML